MTRAAAVSIAGALLAGGVLLPAVQVQAPGASEGTFEGVWSASGARQTLPTERDSPAAIARLSGSVVLTGSGGLGRGFHGEFLGYDDGRDVSLGRWVWTDDQGHRIFGELKGDPIATGRRFQGVITGGTGRYAGLGGEFEFSWQYVVAGEGSAIQGRTLGLKGRYRRGGP
jgi:hypothetical protein